MTNRCCVQVSDGWMSYPCSKAGKHLHGGKFYCGTHHPETIAKRDAKRNAKFEEKLALVRAQSDERKRMEADAARYRHLRDALLDRMHGRESVVFTAFYDHPTPQDAADFDSYLDAAMAASDRYILTEAGRAALKGGE